MDSGVNGKRVEDLREARDLRRGARGRCLAAGVERRSRSSRRFCRAPGNRRAFRVQRLFPGGGHHVRSRPCPTRRSTSRCLGVEAAWRRRRLARPGGRARRGRWRRFSSGAGPRPAQAIARRAACSPRGAVAAAAQPPRRMPWVLGDRRARWNRRLVVAVVPAAGGWARRSLAAGRWLRRGVRSPLDDGDGDGDDGDTGVGGDCGDGDGDGDGRRVGTTGALRVLSASRCERGPRGPAG